MLLFGLEIGSWADWVGSVSTLVAVLIALSPWFKKLKKSDLAFQILVNPPRRKSGIVGFTLDIINPNGRLEVFEIDSFHIGYTEPYGYYKANFEISDFNLRPFSRIPSGYSVPCPGEKRKINVLGKQGFVRMLDVHDARRYLVKMVGVTKRDKEKYFSASVFEVDSASVRNISTITKKNIDDESFDKLIKEVINGI